MSALSAAPAVSYTSKPAARASSRRADEGGVWGDPFEGLTIENGVLTIRLYGGNAWRWGYQYQFQCNGDELLLTKTETVGFHIYTQEGTKTVCDYIRGTWETREFSEEDDGLLLDAGTFDPIPSTFDAPMLDEHSL